MTEEKDQSRTVHVKFSEEEINDIDQWKKGRRIRTRSEAIRQMIRYTLENDIGNEEISSNYGMGDKEGAHFIPPSGKTLPAELSPELANKIQDVVKEEVKRLLQHTLEKK